MSLIWIWRYCYYETIVYVDAHYALLMSINVYTLSFVMFTPLLYFLYMEHDII